jgi:hypothetical protein
VDDILTLLFELKDAGVLDVRRAGDTIALLLPPHIPLLSIPSRIDQHHSKRGTRSVP